MRDISIKRKLTLLTMISSTLALLLVSGAFIVYQLSTVSKQITSDLSTTAQIISDRSQAIIQFNGIPKEGADLLSALKAKEHIASACIYKGTNQFALYFRDKPNTATAPPLHIGADDKWVLNFRKNQADGFKYITSGDDILGAVYLRSDLDLFYSYVWHYLEIIFLFMIVSLAITYVFAKQFQRIITRPILHLAKTAKIVSERKDFSIRAKRQTADELGDLTDDFNEMLGQIQERDQALHSANEELEKRVWSRTQDLQMEIAERKRAEEALQQQVARISLLNQITFAVAARQDFDSIILIALQQLEEHLPVDYGSAYRYDVATETLVAMARASKSRAIAEELGIPKTIPLAATPFRPCIAGEMVYIPDGRKLRSTMAANMSQHGLLSCIAGPLIVDKEAFGILVLLRRKIDGFNEAEREFIRGLNAHVATAIRQAQLYQDLQKAYNELRQTQQVVTQQERLKALGQMASGVAHDVNNALSPIVGFADLIARNEKALSEDTKRHLNYIKTAGEDIAHIVSGLREFYRPRDERESLLPLNLNKVTAQVVDMTRPRWRDMAQGQRGVNIQVKMDLDSALPDFIGIESEIREALTNLIINAVDALPNGGTITIRTRPEERPSPRNKNEMLNYVIIEVSDTGVGMDEETRRRCLEPFFSTKGRHGTGLGLAMVYGVVERHEGDIEIESEVGKGTVMRLILPIRAIASSDTSDFKRNGRLPSLRILCIDDEPLIRELVKEMLEHDGHKVETTDGGETGMTVLRAARERKDPFDVVITDLGMPNMDGRQVAANVKQESPEIPVIMLTGWGALIKEEGGQTPNVDAILSKPPKLKEIQDTLRRVLKRKSTRK